MSGPTFLLMSYLVMAVAILVIILIFLSGSQ